ncbi:MAG: HEPN domain-containing protein [Candidatus Bathyarchaeia archaeon]
MVLPIPTKLEEPLIKALDRLVEDGLYQSRSEAIRDSVRRLVERSYISMARFLRIIAEIAAQTILIKYKDIATDIIVYGSVASGQTSEDSDVDILVLIFTEVHRSISQVEIGVHEVTYPIALASGTVITSIVLDRGRFIELYRKGEHFMSEVAKKGTSLHEEILNELRDRKYLRKAEARLEAARELLRSDRYEDTTSRAYYCILCCARAALATKDCIPKDT